MTEDISKNKEFLNYVENLEAAHKDQRNKNLQLQQALTSSRDTNKDDSIIRIRLELEKEKIQLEHFFAGDIKDKDNEGNVIWIQNPDKEEIAFNKKGVRLMMEHLELFTSRAIMLSGYELERVNEILVTIGDDLNDYLHDNAEELGMDTRYKQSKYKIMIMNTLFFLEAIFRRAIGGNESQATQPNISIHQLDNPRMNSMPIPSMEAQRKVRWI